MRLALAGAGLAAAALAGAGCSSSPAPAQHVNGATRPPAAVATTPPPSPSAPAVPTVITACRLGYEDTTSDVAKLLPRTRANSVLAPAFLVLLTAPVTNTADVTVNEFAEQNVSPTGQVIESNLLGDGTEPSNYLAGLPRLLAPGESVSFLVTFGSLTATTQVNVSASTYQRSTCRITRWD
jgi:hypothetical protein